MSEFTGAIYSTEDGIVKTYVEVYQYTILMGGYGDWMTEEDHRWYTRKVEAIAKFFGVEIHSEVTTYCGQHTEVTFQSECKSYIKGLVKWDNEPAQFEQFFTEWNEINQEEWNDYYQGRFEFMEEEYY